MTKEERQIYKITCRIEQLFNELNIPELYAEADEYFHYDIQQDDSTYVFYSIINSEKIVDDCYRTFITKHSKFHTVPISMFTFSLLHEIGHHLTIGNFTEKDFTDYETQAFLLSHNKFMTEEQIQTAYMLLPLEYEANIKAIEIMEQHLTILYNFENDMQKLFEKLNLILDNY